MTRWQIERRERGDNGNWQPMNITYLVTEDGINTIVDNYSRNNQRYEFRAVPFAQEQSA